MRAFVVESERKNHNGTKDFFRMDAGEAAEITKLLKAWSAGDAAALDRLTPALYAELRRRAHRYMRQERSGNTLPDHGLGE
jgi:hypothetical protein